MSQLLTTKGFKLIDKDLDSNQHSSNSSTGCVLKVILEYPKININLMMLAL